MNLFILNILCLFITIYFVSVIGYKIGMTRGKIEKRIKQLQTGNSEEITLLKYHETEYPFFLENGLHLNILLILK